jgi:hypothetical protein
VNAIQRPLSGLKNVLQKIMKHFKDFSSRFTELLVNLYASTPLLHGATSQKTAFFIVTAVKTSNLTSTLLDFAIHHRQSETQSKKKTLV